MAVATRTPFYLAGSWEEGEAPLEVRYPYDDRLVGTTTYATAAQARRAQMPRSLLSGPTVGLLPMSGAPGSKRLPPASVPGEKSSAVRSRWRPVSRFAIH